MFGTSASSRTQFSSIARISGPLIVNFLAVAGMNLADVMMSGRLGADALAAVSVGSSTWMLACVLLGILSPGDLAAQWTAHTSTREVVALASSGEEIWAATTGGVFSYNPATGEPRLFTVAEGLHDVQTRAIAYDDRRDLVWIGYFNGVIDRLDVQTGEVRTFFDIERNDRFPSPEINRLQVRGDTLVVATSFGVVLFDPVR